MKKSSVAKSSSIIAVVFLAILAFGPGKTNARNSPNSWIFNPANGHYYQNDYTGRSWYDCLEYAATQNAHPVTIMDSSEEVWLAQIFALEWPPFSTWIGFTDEAEEGHWIWVTREPTTYTNWALDEPSNDNPDNYARIVDGEWDATFEALPVPCIIEQGLDQSITGRITDVNNNPVPNVTIVANSNLAGSITGQTDSSGYYTFTNVANGTYILTPYLTTFSGIDPTSWTFWPKIHAVVVPTGANEQNFKGYDRPPVVFVTGLNFFDYASFCHQADPDSTFEGIDQAIGAMGYYTGYARLVSSNCSTPSFDANVPVLQAAINQAKSATNQKKVILVAHSMGGLVSRAYIENNSFYQGDVKTLFTLGSPHWGTTIDVIVYFANGTSLNQFCVLQPGLCELSDLSMAAFNAGHQPRLQDVSYHIIGGDSPWSNLTWIGKVIRALI